jgi:hypothetical protein
LNIFDCLKYRSIVRCLFISYSLDGLLSDVYISLAEWPLRLFISSFPLPRVARLCGICNCGIGVILAKGEDPTRATPFWCNEAQLPKWKKPDRMPTIANRIAHNC